MKTLLGCLLFLILALILVSLNNCGGSDALPPSEVKNVVILGVDGMDPRLLERYTSTGIMPNFKKLMDEGSFAPLATSNPPQSPVAWSTFITGCDPGVHGIFDFIHVDHSNYMPEFSAALVSSPAKTIKIGSWVIPLSSGKVELLRRGEAFWQCLDTKNIPYTIFRIPANFPPVDSKGVTTAGMGTPDVLGSYGTFSFFTDDPSFQSLDVSGGQIIPITVDNDMFTSHFIGPDNTFKVDNPPLTRDFTVSIDRDNKAARIDIDGGETVLLSEGDWSDWIQLEFNPLGPFHKVTGITRLYLKSLAPYFELYATPINIDPSNPALPISTPPDFCKKLYEKIGFYYTQGMPEDTKALEWGVFNDGEFVDQANFVFTERERMLDAILDDYKGGLLFFYFSTLDQTGHMMWRNIDPAHPGHTEAAAKYAHQMEKFYARMDSTLGVVRERIPKDALLIVMSDHGFAPFYKKFHLNTWLYKNGYISLLDASNLDNSPLFKNVFWRRTRAYGLGINGLYINLRGRDAEGAVKPGPEYDALVKEISDKLLAYRDPATGAPVIEDVFKREDIYHGPMAEKGPDLVIGFHRGYRCSDESALGGFSKEVLTPNLSKWSGDHCIDPEGAPGIIVANQPILVKDPALIDFARSILKIYDVEPAPEMRGRPLFDY
ncbi:MAG: alkaline phosphatase family protein [bacterium]